MMYVRRKNGEVTMICLYCGRGLREDECRVCDECARESLSGDQSEPMGETDA